MAISFDPSSSGETNLATLLETMEPVLHPDIHVFSTYLSTEARPADPAIRMQFVENEGVTLIWPRDVAQQHGADWTFESRMITLNVHSALDAVGFMAAISTALAQAGIGCNPVAGYYHDHLFVPADRADDAMACLRSLSRNHPPA